MKKILFIFVLLLLALPLVNAKEKKAKKSKKTPKNKTKIEKTQKSDSLELEENDGIYEIDGVEFDDTEIITREQIDTMFSLANQLNADIYAAIQEEDEDAAKELDFVIAEQKAQLDKMLPALKGSSEWSAQDEERLKAINADYKAFKKQYKPRQ
ncbi:hypothetical protein MSI_02410 [Treponema sp. JC4]|uniref:hypothetical protein n=1 Tax=Treponema sp. JC4 TaxID=1124982 RepID=UPI00025AFB38|nr:hypothetical protein [Treponema sp. JC4]EID86285.1 hypothetical protein MSI_02410 [Treponema sp. JC4]